MSLNINLKCSRSCNISNSLTSSCEYQTIDKSYYGENCVQDHLHHKNRDIMLVILDYQVSLFMLTTP